MMDTLQTGSGQSADTAPLAARRRTRVWARLWSTPQALFGAVVLCLVVISALFSPVLAPYDPLRQSLLDRLAPPSLQSEQGGTGHLLGTDRLGRDVFSRVIYGSRISLVISLAAVGLSGVIGVALGLMAGFTQQGVSTVIMRFVDVVLSIPFLLLAITVVAVLGPGLLNLILVLGFTRWTRYTRVTYAQTLSLREQEFVEAARTLGAGTGRLLVRHILPNCIAPIIVVATLELGLMVIYEAALSFLGLGVQPPTAAWGSMLADGRDYVATSWWLVTFPGLAIMLMVLGVNLLGDWIRDILDPRMTNVV